MVASLLVDSAVVVVVSAAVVLVAPVALACFGVYKAFLQCYIYAVGAGTLQKPCDRSPLTWNKLKDSLIILGNIHVNLTTSF